MNYFKNNQIVYHSVCGEGSVIETNYGQFYPVLVEFKDSFRTFTKDGREYIDDPITLSQTPFPWSTPSEKDNDDVDYSHMKPFIKNIDRIIQSLEAINDNIEDEGPLSEDIIDAIEALQSFMLKVK